jgi:hypothetical protein
VNRKELAGSRVKSKEEEVGFLQRLRRWIVLIYTAVVTP